MRRVTLNRNILSARDNVRYEKGMYEQDFTVSHDVSYLLFELLERTQLCLPPIDTDCVTTKGIVCACKAPCDGDDGTRHRRRGSRSIGSKCGEGMLRVIVHEGE